LTSPNGITLEASVTHTLLDRRSIVTIVLNGGDLQDREETARAIMAQLAPQYPLSVPDRPAALTSVFALLSSPSVPSAQNLTQARPSPQSPSQSSEPVSAYDEPFILAPLG
jgi:hypothetical protein